MVDDPSMSVFAERLDRAERPSKLAIQSESSVRIETIASMSLGTRPSLHETMFWNGCGLFRLVRLCRIGPILTILSSIPCSLSIIDQSRQAFARVGPHCWMVAYHDECVQVKSRRK